MASTNYEHYKWIINLLDVDEPYALSLKEINDDYRIKKHTFNKPLSPKKRERYDSFSKEWFTETFWIANNTLYNWRVAIYRDFELLIQPQRTKNGGYRGRYYLVNGELLDEKIDLRKIIDHLVEDEKRGYEASQKVIKLEKGRKPKSSSSDGGLRMGFIGMGNNGMFIGEEGLQYGYQEEPEMVDVIRFVMSLGESLPIVNSRTKATRILEPQALKCINNHWYVAGSEYEIGKKEKSSLVIHDAETLKISEEDIEIPSYELIKDFDLTHLIPWDWKKYFENENEVVSLYMEVHGPRFENHPFCSTQVLVSQTPNVLSKYTYKIYVKPDMDFILQYLATGDNVIVCNPHNEIPRTPTDITDEQIEYLRKLKRKG